MDKRGRGEFQDFLSKIFCLTVPKISVGGESFSVSLILGTEKVWIRGAGEYHDFLSKFLSHCTDIFHWRTLWCCFRKILLSKIFMHRRGGHHGFFGSFCLTVPKNFVGEPFSVSLISGTEKVWIRGGSIKIFRRKFFVSVPKISVGEPFSVSLISGTEKVWIKGEYQDFPSKIFCLTVPKYFIGEHFGVVSEKFFYRKFSCIGEGGHHGLVGTFCLTGPKRKAL